ncbi:MAG: hypothetical protein JETT_0486 [Candidatus Jettenia ecosi]|uniref:Uncharacterized protein n=1 Tax=Candidatus Jettenia ecosi TaxID=2494326 RepID=A0A533QEY8_9BACT|nr:MAG: hypothetical protein JETT_0486 [Candidatus Jettenia ecosi]
MPVCMHTGIGEEKSTDKRSLLKTYRDMVCQCHSKRAEQFPFDTIALRFSLILDFVPYFK